jgi:hypothetical protein
LNLAISPLLHVRPVADRNYLYLTATDYGLIGTTDQSISLVSLESAIMVDSINRVPVSRDLSGVDGGQEPQQGSELDNLKNQLKLKELKASQGSQGGGGGGSGIEDEIEKLKKKIAELEGKQGVQVAQGNQGAQAGQGSQDNQGGSQDGGQIQASDYQPSGKIEA